MLNQGQQAGADQFLEFLLSGERAMIIKGAGGFGKTYLLQHLIDTVLPKYKQSCDLLGIPCKHFSANLTALTNTAADVLSGESGHPCDTIHSFMRVRVDTNFATGETKLCRSRDWNILSNVLVFIDEAPMTSRQLFGLIEETFDSSCKIVYVGDHRQLTPVKEGLSPIYSQGYREAELTEPVRNAGAPLLAETCVNLRNTVDTGKFFRLPDDNVQIIRVDDDTGPDYVLDMCKVVGRGRILAYANSTVLSYQNFVRTSLKLPAHLVPGDAVVSNTMLRISTTTAIPAETRLTVMAAHPEDPELYSLGSESLECYRVTVASSYLSPYSVLVPVRTEERTALLNKFKRSKQWNMFYTLQERVPDFRFAYASTVHKAQGATFDEVFIDLADLATCTNFDTAARLLYVAVSRARKRVFLYGELTARYGI